MLSEARPPGLRAKSTPLTILLNWNRRSRRFYGDLIVATCLRDEVICEGAGCSPACHSSLFSSESDAHAHEVGFRPQ